MRKAAGIILIIGGASWMLFYGFTLIGHLHLPYSALVGWLLFVILGAFAFTGGVFCLKRQYWKLCFASALLAVAVMIFQIAVRGDLLRYKILNASGWWIWSFIITGTLPIIFVSLRRSEWKEISDSVDGKVSYDD
jgi:hypothetical protein